MKCNPTLFVCLLLANLAVKAQNLIANPEFDDINTCCENSALCAHEGWFMISTSRPTQFSGTASNPGYAALNLGTEDAPYSTYCLMSPLLCNMRAGEQYEVTLVVQPIAEMISRIELLFSDTMSIHLPDITEASLVYDGTGKKGMVYSKQSDEVILTQTYTATGKERFVMIGLFNRHTPVKRKRIKKHGASYLIHSISVKPLNHNLDCDIERMKELVYNENRRHDFGYKCSEQNTNLFPHLLVNTVQVKNEYVDPRIKRFADAKKANEKPIDNVLRNLNFETGKSVLTLAAYNEVSRLVVILHNKKDKRVKLIGYTDNQGNDAQNLKLSIDRAKAVYNFLVSKGINPARITYEGKGAENPIDSNDTESGRSNNRRVEFFLSD